MSRLLADAQNFCGPLSPEIRARIIAYLSAPSEDGWSDIAGIIVAPSIRRGSLWQAVMAVDPTFPNEGPVTDRRGKRLRGWSRIPDAVLLARAIRNVTGGAA